jgi:hypothetical protein
VGKIQNARYLAVKATEEQVKSVLISQKRAESEAAWKGQSQTE